MNTTFAPQQNAQLNSIFTTAYNEYEKVLRLRAFYKVSNQELAEDLVQKTFIKTWMYLKKGGKIELMKAFLYHVLNNLIIDEYRKKKTTSLDLIIEKGFEPSIDDYERFIDVLDGETAVLLIDQLPEKQRQIMHMRYVQDLSLQEISSITGQSKNNIAVQAHRGMDKLKSLYKSRQ